MIKNNLAILMAERNLKASKISAETGISRSTLNSISTNSSKMIQLETINSLCQYLDVTPNDFFDFIPFDITFQSELSENPKTKCVFRDFHDDSVNSFEITGLIFDGYLKQSYTRNSTGKHERTFDISVKQTNKITALDFSENDRKVPIKFEVLLGHETDSETFLNQEADFNSLWNNNLNTNFQTSIKEEIMNSITTNFSILLNNLFENDEDYSDALPIINRINILYDFSFYNAYNDKVKANPIIDIDLGNDFPF